MVNHNLIHSALGRIWEHTPLAARETGFLVGIDALTNLADYGFHVYMGRALAPGDFAVLQTINAILLIIMTTCAVMEPVVARYVAEAGAAPKIGIPARLQPDHERSIFQRFFRGSAVVGTFLVTNAWLGRGALANWLNVPTPVVSLTAIILLFALLRPVVSGMLQGKRRFISFGLTRSTYALSRLAIGVILVSLGRDALGAVTALPIGSFLALLAGLCFLGAAVWKPGPALPLGLMRDGVRLSASAFVAYAAFMSLLNNDLLWVNRSFDPEQAGAYAAVVLLRRVILLLPGAVVVTMYPRLVAKVAQGKLPDRLLLKTAGFILAVVLVLTGIYFAFGLEIVQVTFGHGYVAASSLLGWMGLAMLGYSFSSVWMNLYLATRPGPYVLLLAVTAWLQNTLLARQHATLSQVTSIFSLRGWILVLGGGLLYLLWLRPGMKSAVYGSQSM